MVKKLKCLLENNKYVLGISLDITKAFDSAWWPLIKLQLRKIKCPRNIFQLIQDYLRNRAAVLQYGQHYVRKSVSKGCPQGSVCGPLLWNITFDCFLREDFGQDHSTAYADDVMMLIGGRSRADLENKGNLLIQNVYNWGIEHKLHFNPIKTKGIVFNKPRGSNLYRRPPHLVMNGNVIKVEKTLKYLGVFIDFRLSWDKHIEFITNRTGLIFQAFAQVARKNWGLSTDAMAIIYDAIYIPIITYACGTWGWATSKVHTKRKLISSQRRALLLLTKAYRTANNQSLQVIARRPPIDMFVIQRCKLQQVKWGNTIQTTFRNITYDEVEWAFPFYETTNPDILVYCDDNNVQKTDIQIFTDGSRINGMVGCSFVAYINNDEIYNQTIRLDTCCTVFQAEMLAIKLAINWTKDSYDNAYIHIYTDSLSALNIINSTKLHPIAEEIRQLIRLSNCNYTVTWVRAHQGTTGNERADTLAKQAAENTSLIINYNKLSQRTLRRMLWEDTMYNWQDRWNENRSHITYDYIPDIQQFYKLKWFTPDYYTTQFFTGHGKFASYLARFTNRTSNECPTCHIIDGSKHYFYNCVMTERERQELRVLMEELGVRWPCNLSDIWINKNVYNAFIKLAKQTVKIANQLIYN
ncbi:uncharacterized protein [Centruroides vittatus]|uniref:uncharacterized protein n=1 Tax=Centruroides vittatus TaxID=120091 RepID=UPI0035103441